MKRFLSLFVAASAILIALTTANAQKPAAAGAAGCQNLPSESQLRQLLVQAQNVITCLRFSGSWRCERVERQSQLLHRRV